MDAVEMNEFFLHYVWQMRLWEIGVMSTVDGLALEVLDPGIRNHASGPDFFNAKVKIDGREWAGDVEIHVRASDWHRHGHDGDAAYNSVVLHVVAVDDTRIRRADSGEEVPQTVLRPREGLYERYTGLIERADLDVACGDTLRRLPGIIVYDWISALGVERLYAKAARVDDMVARTCGDWEEAAYRTVARALGFGTNADAMQRLAESLPLRVVRKHADSLLSVEALLFGQAGLLANDSDDRSDYLERLRQEYAFLAAKFGLRPMAGGLKRSGMRPANSPHRRIALLASLIAGPRSLAERLLAVEEPEDAADLFAADLTGWWKDHFNFGYRDRATAPGALGRDTVNLLVINAVVPFITAWRLAHGDGDAVARGVDLLENLPPESNRFTTAFGRCGIKCSDALTSQAVIHLRREYCEARKCLDCRFGYRAMTQAAPVAPAPA